MKQILDAEDPIPVSSRTFSRLSFATALLTLFLFSQINTYIQNRDAGGQDHIPPRYLAYAVFLLGIIGPIITLLSFVRKEPNTVLKWIGAFFNVTWFLLILTWIINFNLPR